MNLLTSNFKKKLDDHASQFEVTGNYNSVNRELFRKALIKHMRENLICIDTDRGQPVYHYYNPDTHLNVMIKSTLKLTNSLVGGVYLVHK